MAKNPSDSEIWDACADVFQSEKRPLEVWRVASVCNLTEEQVMAALIRETGERRKSVTFRYPPIPRAAITEIS